MQNLKQRFYKTLIIVYLLFMPMILFAQTNMEDVVFLKNGSIIHGVIIEQIPDQTLKIKTNDENIFVYKWDEILKISKEKKVNIEKLNQPEKNEFRLNHYTNITELSIQFPHSNNEDYVGSFGIHDIFAYHTDPYFSIGLGTGIEIWNDATRFPIYTDLRVNTSNSNVTFFLGGDIGYSICSNGQSGGVFYNPSLGFKIYTKFKTAIMLSISLDIQQNIQSVGTYYGGTLSYNYYNTGASLNFKIGYEF